MVKPPKDLNSCDEETMKEFLSSFDNVFTDCDGVLWYVHDPIENSREVVNRFRDLGKSLVFVTNNSMRSRADDMVRMEKLGFHAKQDEIINTAYLAAEYLNKLNFKKKVYVIGFSGITNELDRVGIRHLGLGPDVMDTDILTYIRTKMKLDPEVEAVVLGVDEHLSFPKMMKSVNYLKNPNCHFIVTECEETFAVDGILFPLSGSIVKSLERATNTSAYFVGKPSDHVVDIVKNKYAANPSRSIMIGDSHATDIVFGKKCGFKTLLVLSGVTSREKLQELIDSGNPDVVPDYYINTLGDLLKHLPC